MLAAALAGCGQGRGEDGGAPEAGAGPTDVPFALVPYWGALADGGLAELGLNLVVPLSLGDAGPIEAILDTGSSGLQLLANLLPPATLAALTPGTISYGYSFVELGIDARGTVDSATVLLGGRATPSPIPIVVYDQLGCTSASLCPTDGGGLEPYVFNGYPAILGVGLRNSWAGSDAIGSPIAQLPGQPAFLVKAPEFGGDAGLVRIGPSAAEVATYSTYQLPADSLDPSLPNGTPSWNDWAVPACIDDGSTGADYCGSALLDTGTPFIAIWWAGQMSTAELAPASNVSVSVGPASGPIGQFDVTVGSPPQFGLDDFVLAPQLPGYGSLLVLGLPVFSRYDVLFDAARGQIGLLPH